MDHQRYKDKGWAWMSAVGAAWCMFSVVASFKCQGILFVEFLTAFEASSALTAWMMGVTACGMSIFSPAATYFANRYSCRNVVAVGTLLCSMSAFFTAFAPNIYFVICVYGMLTGIGYACLLGPSLMMVNVYFNKNRTLANGVALSGASIGQLVIPIMMTTLVKHYTVWGALIIYSAFLLHGFVAALLMRPLSFYDKYKNKPKDPINNCDKDEKMCSITTVIHDSDNENESNHIPLCNGNHSNQKQQEVVDIGTKSASTNNISPKRSPQSTTRSRPCLRLLRNISQLYQWVHLKNSLYLLYLGACIFGNSSYVDMSMMIPPLVASLEIGKDVAAYLLAIVGVGDFFGRILGGVFAYQKFVKASWQMSVAMMIIGVTTIACTVVQRLESLVVMCGVLGVFGGAYVSVYTIVLIDFLGLPAFPSAFGLMVMFQGFFNTALPPVLGWLKDVTGSYQATYFLLGGFMLLSGSFLLLEPCARKCQSKRAETTGAEPNHEDTATSKLSINNITNKENV